MAERARVFELLGLKLGSHHDAPLVPDAPTAKSRKVAAPKPSGPRRGAASAA